MKYLLVLMTVLMVSCYKPPVEPPKPKIECSDKIVYKWSYYSNLYNRRIYWMAFVKKNGFAYNSEVWFDLYWSRWVGQTVCD